MHGALQTGAAWQRQMIDDFIKIRRTDWSTDSVRFHSPRLLSFYSSLCAFQSISSSSV